MKIQKFENYKAEPYDEKFTLDFSIAEWYDQLVNQLKNLSEILGLKFEQKVKDIHNKNVELFVFSKGRELAQFYLDLSYDNIWFIELEEKLNYSNLEELREFLLEYFK